MSPRCALACGRRVCCHGAGRPAGGRAVWPASFALQPHALGWWRQHCRARALIAGPGQEDAQRLPGRLMGCPHPTAVPANHMLTLLLHTPILCGRAWRR